MRRSLNILLIGLIVVLKSCIDPYDTELNTGNNLLIVEGLITNLEGPYTIKLQRSAAFEPGVEGRLTPAVGANVRVIVDDGSEHVFFESRGTGVYRNIDPDIFLGAIGRTYTLRIETSDGKVYMSDPVTMPDGPVIDSTYVEFIEQTRFNERGIEVPDHGFDVVVDVTDPGQTENYYRWKWRAWYQVVTSNAGDCCAVCYVRDDPNPTMVLRDDAFVNGNQIRRQEVAFIPFDARQFHDYLVQVEQIHMDEQAYRYFELIGQQQNNVGSIFDPAPAQIRGNISNIDDPGETVLGYFGAFSISFGRVTFNHSNASLNFNPLYQDADGNIVLNPLLSMTGDCRTIPNSSSIPPTGF